MTKPLGMQIRAQELARQNAAESLASLASPLPPLPSSLWNIPNVSLPHLTNSNHVQAPFSSPNASLPRVTNHVAAPFSNQNEASPPAFNSPMFIQNPHLLITPQTSPPDLSPTDANSFHGFDCDDGLGDSSDDDDNVNIVSTPNPGTTRPKAVHAQTSLASQANSHIDQITAKEFFESNENKYGTIFAMRKKKQKPNFLI